MEVQTSNKSYKIGGCDVSFPHAAYGTQLSFMGKVIQALDNKHNALLEAPTGSGKTLSLLCSSLAWQEREKRRVASLEGATGFGLADAEGQESLKEEPSGSQPGGGFLRGDLAGDKQEEVKTRAPKIYYATRTHSQIAQVVAELKRSGYKPKMAILGSKQHYCVNAFVRNKPSIEEACEDALKRASCNYFKGTQTWKSSAMHHLYDVEDLCRLGKQRKGCPYFLSRNLASEADIIFGPYNYLLDPVIRRSMGIELEDSVFIFDEAHNIEDVCRDSGSMEINLDTLNEMIASLARACKYNMKPEVYDPLHALVQSMKNWIMKEDAILKQGNRGDQEKIWMGLHLIHHLQTMGLGPERMELLWDAYLAAREHDEEMMAADRGKRGEQDDNANGAVQSQNKPSRIGAVTLGTISRVVQMVKILHAECKDGGRDYRLVLTRTKDQEAGMPRRRQSRQDTHVASLMNVTLSLWCLNPGIIFKQIACKAHSVVLTSGTLAPLDSFSSELGTTFQVSLEAPHVVNMKKQVFAGVISTTPQGQPLLATYQHSSKTSFQDAVGQIILNMCSTVPDGLLVFFPSYAMLEKLISRWKETGIMEEMKRSKAFVQEPRSGGAEALKKTMEEYYEGINSNKGGLFFAVCRGKVSEGLDFSDRNARGVIIVGIPFPNLKDSKVDAKKRYNDAGSKSLGLLTGGQWYEQQAFRALNQALGRCIRHKNDWGAILLADERFKNPRLQGSLSRWIRSNLTILPSLGQFQMALEDFFSTHKRHENNTARQHGVLPLPVPPEKGKTDALQILMAGHKKKKPPQAFDDDDDTHSPSSCYLPAQKPLSPDEDSSVTSIVRQAPLQEWVQQDIQEWRTLAITRKSDLNHKEATICAIAGLDEALTATMNNKDKGHDRFAWMENLAVSIPRGLQALFPSVIENLEPRGPVDPRVDRSVITYGREHGWPDLDTEALLAEIHSQYRTWSHACINEENDIDMTVHVSEDHSRITGLKRTAAESPETIKSKQNDHTPTTIINVQEEVDFLQQLGDDAFSSDDEDGFF
jgi:fanconi anemia group J protein